MIILAKAALSGAAFAQSPVFGLVRMFGQEADSTAADVRDVLDFVNDVYEENGFYKSGYWGKEEDSRVDDIYTGPLPYYDRNDFTVPAAGPLTSRFGFRRKYGRFHKGIDIAVCTSDTIRVALSGTVRHIGTDPDGYGLYVIISHENGLETRYAHISSVLAGKGQTIRSGDAIALGGNSGNSTGPHLHFEVRYRGRPVNPEILFNFKRMMCE